MINEYEFINLFLIADEEIKDQVEKVLVDSQPPTEFEE